MKKTLLSFFIFLSNVLLCQSGQWVTFNTSNTRIPSNNIYSIAIDHQGVKWIGTDAGVVKYDGRTWTVYNQQNSGLYCNYIRSIVVDAENNKWIGTQCGGLHKFDGVNWTNWDKSNSILPSYWVASIAIDRSGVKWIGTGDAGLVKIDGDKWTLYNTSNSILPVNNIFALCPDTLGNIWIGTNGGGTVKFDGSTMTVYNKKNSGLRCNASLAIAIDKDDNKWIGSYTCGIFKFDGTNWTNYDSLTSALKTNWISAITIDKQQNKWIGMDSTGFAKFDGKNWTAFDQSNSGLINDYVRTIAIDDQGNKWIGTYIKGVSVYNENGVNIPNLIVVSEPVNGTNWIAGSRQTITWTDGGVAGVVNIKLSTDGGLSFPVILVSGTPNDGSETITVPDKPSADCRIKIESVSFPDKTSISGGRFNIIKIAAPQLISPANGSSRQPLKITLSWNKAQWCEKYRLLIASDSLFTHTVTDDTTTSDTLKEVTDLKDNTKYYWKLQGLNSGIGGQWSQVWNFTTLFNPPDSLKASVSGKNRIMLSWRDNSASETGYQIERKYNAGFSILDTALANTTSFTDSAISKPGSYQYRIKAISKGSESDYSNTASVTLTGVNDPPQSLSEFILYQNYPNPFNPATTIHYSLPFESDVKLIIYDLRGMAIRTFSFNSQSAGYQHIVWDGKNDNNEQVASGTYICKLKAVSVKGKSVEKISKMMMLK